MRGSRNVLLAAVVLAAVAPARAGDPSVAKTLLESGKKALNARKVDEAVVHFRKALAEDGNLVEAAYWIGAARDREKDDPGSLAAYRDFLSLLEKRGNPSAEEQKLKGLAEKRVDSLAAGEKEFQKLEDKYVEDLLSFARAKFLRDPAVAALALDRVLAVRPAHPAALSLYEKIGGKPGAKPGEGTADADGGVPAGKGVKAWRDILRNREISSDSITFTGDVMVFDAKGGKKVTSHKPIDEGGNLVYETEFRVVEAYDSGWLAGLTFSEKAESDFLAFFAQSGQVVLLQQVSDRDRKELAQVAVATLEVGTWHRLAVVLRGDAVEGWLDGKKLVDQRLRDRPDLSGELGIFQQACRTERRVFRAGKL
jgi:tetratricopeptide (TPR) repeat protein